MNKIHPSASTLVNVDIDYDVLYFKMTHRFHRDSSVPYHDQWRIQDFPDGEAPTNYLASFHQGVINCGA